MNVLAPNFWTDEKVQALGVTGKLLFAAIVTDDRVNLPGLYAAGPEHFYRSMLPAPVEEVQVAFKRILDAGMAQFDPGRGVLRLPNVWKYAPTPTANQVGGWKSAWLKVPDCSLRYDHISTLRDLAYKGNDAARDAFDAMFGQIKPGNHSTYLLGRDFLKNKAKARREAESAGTRDPSGNLSNNNKINSIIFGGREGDPAEPAAQAGRDLRTTTTTATRTKTRTTTNTGDSRSHLEDIETASGWVGDGVDMESGTHVDAIPQVSNIHRLRTAKSLPAAPGPGILRREIDSHREEGELAPTYHSDEEEQ